MPKDTFPPHADWHVVALRDFDVAAFGARGACSTTMDTSAPAGASQTNCGCDAIPPGGAQRRDRR
eukprot:gene550-24762_t